MWEGYSRIEMINKYQKSSRGEGGGTVLMTTGKGRVWRRFAISMHR